VTENNANAVIPAGDGATTIGINPQPNAILLSYGAHVSAAAQALVALGLTSNNIVDPVNQLSDAVNSTPVMTSAVKSKLCAISYAKGPNLVRYAQEAAGVLGTYKMDYLPNLGTSYAPPNYAIQNVAEYSIAGSALTAGVYGSTAVNPTATPPIGTYAILGLRVYAITFGAVVRFQHADFLGAYPGIPVVTYGGTANTPAHNGGNFLTSDGVQGYQFLALSQAMGIPLCPVFRVQGQSTGLNVQALDTLADTPQYDIILQKIA
jgi:hypothetical protein